MVGRLVEFGYLCLEDSDFPRTAVVMDLMRSRNYGCFYAHLKKCHRCETETVEVWNPSERLFLEADFDYSGVLQIERLKLSAGKNTYFGPKAAAMAEKRLFATADA